MCLVLQETQLFHAPVWQNIAYGRQDTTRDEIVAAARLAQAHDFIEALPEGYDTVVGQGGNALRRPAATPRHRAGGGRDGPILIMDEPTSGLDTESERLVFEALNGSAKGRTTFVIAHRSSTSACRRDSRPRRGPDRERGTHDEADGPGRALCRNWPRRRI